MCVTRREVAGWAVAVIIVALMGEIVLHGPFGIINKAISQSAPAYPTLHVKISADPRTVGRFTPASITVHVGQKVVFTNVSNAAHTVTARNNAFDSGNLDVGAAWTLTAKKLGTFHYYCIYHPFMLGVITVQP